MEICGGQTHSIVRHGIDRLLPPGVTLLHGPGCPVCVTPAEMHRHRGRDRRRTGRDLLLVRRHAAGAGTTAAACSRPRRAAPMCAWSIRRSTRCASRGKRPTGEVVFFAIGFETTAPTTAMAVAAGGARRDRAIFRCWSPTCWCRRRSRRCWARPTTACRAFWPQAMSARSWATGEYEPIARAPSHADRRDRLRAARPAARLYLCIRQLEQGRAEVENHYSRSVRREGNRTAQDLMRRVFTVQPQRWRGIGEIAASGLGLAPSTRATMPVARFGRCDSRTGTPERMHQSGEVLRGLQKPTDCPAFGTRCTPEHRWARRWCPRKAPAPPITAIAAWRPPVRSARASRPSGNWHDRRRRLRAVLPAPGRRPRGDRTRPWRRRAVDASADRRVIRPAFATSDSDFTHDGAVLDMRWRKPRLHHRLLRGAPAVLPGRRYRHARRQRHRQRPGDVRRPTALSECRPDPRRRAADRAAPPRRGLDARVGRRRRGAAGHRRYQGRRARQGRRALYQHRGHRRGPLRHAARPAAGSPR